MKRIIQYTTWICLLVWTMGLGYGQVTKSVGARMTDNTVEKELKTNAILDLESTSKGFFLPRMNTAQRDALLQNMTDDNGLAVYNVDNDCIEYWSARVNKWRSLCGSLSPATIEIEAGSCNTIAFSGFTMVGGKPQAQQGTALSPDKQFITLRIKVDQIGTYNITALTDNGYFFSGEGQFQATGTYQIVLKGMGTPINGYTNGGGDMLKFMINGNESTVCTTTQVLVIPADLKFRITSSTHQAQGKYYVGVGAKAEKDNIIVVDVNVINGGMATIKASNSAVGLVFKATKELESNTTTQMVLEPVSGENIPSENTQTSYPLTFEVNTLDPEETIDGKQANVVIEETKIQAQFEQVDFGAKPYYQGDGLTETHTIELPIKVLGSGKTNLFLKGAGGIEFKAEEVMLKMPEEADELQYVVFKGVNGTLPATTGIDLTLSGDAARLSIENDTLLHLPISKKPVEYTMDCSTIKTSRQAMPYNKPIGENYTISLTVDVVVAGEYEITTSMPIDGIIFSTTRGGVKQVFTQTGRQEVTLYAVDGTKIPTSRGEYTVELIANDGSEARCNQVKLKVGYSDINILILKGAGDSMFEYTINEDLFFTGKNSDGKYRFGVGGAFTETGEVKVKVVDVLSANFPSVRAQLVTDIREGKYNFISTSGQSAAYAIDSTLANALHEYVVNKQGVLWLQTIYHYANGEHTINYVQEHTTNVPSSLNSPGGGKEKEGYRLIQRFNDNRDLESFNQPSERNYNMIVVNENDNWTKPRNGYNYVSNGRGGYLDIHWYLVRDLGALSYIDARNTNFRPLVADRGAQFGDQKGLVFVHRTYENLFWAPVVRIWPEGMLAVDFNINANGTPLNRDEGDTNTGAFMANIYTAIMEYLANK
ncbi:hypothetical protein [Myroides sp. WP-1]|uniref:hypothetical protein n=1 Tax=Myroides sp. WP-1 TaxID=2759944 RepID=UPI001C726702|nr:hypothetical protein [Myroides sp. WP-1]